MFIETTTDSRIRSSVQRLFMMMTNGFGAIFGSLASGYVIEKYFTINGTKDWHHLTEGSEVTSNVFRDRGEFDESAIRMNLVIVSVI